MALRRCMPFNPSSKCLTITRGNIQYLMLWVQPMKKENGWRKVFYLTQKIILIYCVNISSKIIFLCTGSCLVKTYKNLQNHAGSFTYHPLTFCCHQGKKKGGGDSNQFSQIVKLMFYSYSQTFMNLGNKCALPFPLAQHANSQLLERSAVGPLFFT